MAFPLTSLTENFSDGKKPTQEQWYELIDQVRPYTTAADRQTLINSLYNDFKTGNIVSQTQIYKIIQACSLARPFAANYVNLLNVFTDGFVPNGSDFKTLIDALNYTQLPCVVRFMSTAAFNEMASTYLGHVLGIVLEASIDPDTVSGTKLITHMATSSSGSWSVIDAYTMGNTTAVPGGWLSDVTFSKVTLRVLLASTTTAQQVNSASMSLYMSKTSNGSNRQVIFDNIILTQKDYNGLVATISNVEFSLANYANLLGQNAYLFLLANIQTT